MLIIARSESKDKAIAENYYLLKFDDKMDITEKTIDLNGSYSLVFCEQLTSNNVVMVFAPKKYAEDISKYVHFQYDMLGK